MELHQKRAFDEAVALLHAHAHGYAACRLEEGVPEWRQRGLPVAVTSHAAQLPPDCDAQ